MSTDNFTKMPRSLSKPNRILRYPELKAAGVPFTNKHVNTLEARGEFPRRVRLGENCVGWVAEEVQGWVEDKIRHREATDAIGATSPNPRDRKSSQSRSRRSN